MANKSTLESALQAKILRDLNSYGKYCEAFKVESPSCNGEPDIFFTTTLTNGVLIETKRLGEELRALQASKAKKLNMCGSKTFKCDSWEGWVAVKNALGLTKENVIKHYNEQNCVISNKNL